MRRRRCASDERRVPLVSRRAWLALLLLAACQRAESEPLRVAVASNFAAPLERIAAEFRERTGHPVELSSGSSGKLYAQIENGAPFHVFLSADAERPELLERSGHAKPGSRFTYAVGRLVLYGEALRDAANGEESLRSDRFSRLAIANPATAPYGAAARQALEKLEVWRTLAPKIVRGENVSHAAQFVESGAAELGLVPLSMVVNQPKDRYWLVPETLHDPILQDGVISKAGEARPDAAAFVEFLRGDVAHAIIRASGYQLP